MPRQGLEVSSPKAVAAKAAEAESGGNIPHPPLPDTAFLEFAAAGRGSSGFSAHGVCVRNGGSLRMGEGFPYPKIPTTATLSMGSEETKAAFCKA